MSDDYYDYQGRDVLRAENNKIEAELDRLRAESADWKAEADSNKAECLRLFSELDRLQALAADLRNRLYFRGENVDEADAILLPNGWPSPDTEG